MAGATTIRGDAETALGTAITGAGALTLLGTNHGGDGVTVLAMSDLTAAYLNAAGHPADVNYSAVADLGGLTLAPGVHRGASSLAITGILTPDGGGNPNAVWIFQAYSSLISAANSAVIFTNGAQSSYIFWQVGSSATLGTGSHVEGNLLALTSVTLTTGATVDGGCMRGTERSLSTTISRGSLSRSRDCWHWPDGWA